MIALLNSLLSLFGFVIGKIDNPERKFSRVGFTDSGHIIIPDDAGGEFVYFELVFHRPVPLRYLVGVLTDNEPSSGLPEVNITPSETIPREFLVTR